MVQLNPLRERRAVLVAALACTRLTANAPEVLMVRSLLDSWRGIGLIVQGMVRQGHRVSITNVSEGEWRAVFSSHPLASPEGFAVDRVPWRAVQRAAWEALRDV